MLLGANDPALRSGTQLAEARADVAAYAPATAAQRRERDRILAFVDAHPDALLRTCAPGHLTGSAAVVGADGRVLLTLHRKLERWLQLGGHCDGDANLAAVALREAQEESGIADLAIHPVPVDVDIHAVPCPPGTSGQHLDVRYLVVAPPGAEAVVSPESIELGWFAPDELPDDFDTGGRRLVAAALATLEALHGAVPE